MPGGRFDTMMLLDIEAENGLRYLRVTASAPRLESLCHPGERAWSASGSTGATISVPISVPFSMPFTSPPWRFG
jgi:hypothetical protein